MKIFRLENNIITYDSEILMIPEFHVLYKRDKTAKKEVCFQEFQYIYFVCDWSSPYRNYIDIDERKKIVKKDYIKKENWTEDEAIKAAINRYEELSKTPVMGLVEDAYAMVNKLRKYFLNVDFTLLDKSGKRVDKANEGMANLERLGKVVESLKKLEEIAAKEKVENTRTRGQIETAYDEE